MFMQTCSKRLSIAILLFRRWCWIIILTGHSSLGSGNRPLIFYALAQQHNPGYAITEKPLANFVNYSYFK